MREWLATKLRQLASRLSADRVASSTKRLPLYVYFDEAGDLDFNVTGSKFFLLGLLVTSDPWPLSNALNAVRERVYRGAFIKAKFHASEDLQATRDAVFECIQVHGRFQYHVAVVEKATIPASFREDAAFYTTMADFALRATLNFYPAHEPIYVITDQLPMKRKRDAVKKGFQNCLSSIANGRPYEIGHHASEAHPCLQIADYVNWAVFRKWEREDLRSYDLIRPLIEQEVKFDGRLLRG